MSVSEGPNATEEKDVARGLRRIGWRKLCLLVLLLAFLLLNGIAWMQARAMTHYLNAGQRTPAIEAMSLPRRVWTIATGVSIPKPQNSHTPSDVGLQFQTHRISIGDEWLEGWYVPAPQAHGLVLMFPGYAESKDSLLTTAAAFHDFGYNTFLIDYRGTGGSSGQDTTLGVREATDVALSVRYAQQTWPGQRVVLYGISMGATAVLRAVAVEGVAPSALILESPFDRLTTAVSNRFDAIGLPSFPASEVLVFWGSIQQGFNGFAHNPVEYARSVKCPTLLMDGDHDPRVTVEQARSIYNNLSGPKEFVLFPGAGHVTLLDASPQLWKEHVTNLLTQATGGK